MAVTYAYKGILANKYTEGKVIAINKDEAAFKLKEDKIIRKIIETEKLGAKIIDLGASSSRPGSIPVSEDEEIKKLLPTIEIIKKHSNKLLISIDTFRSNVAKICIEKGADIINDIA